MRITDRETPDEKFDIASTGGRPLHGITPVACTNCCLSSALGLFPRALCCFMDINLHVGAHALPAANEEPSPPCLNG